MTIVCLILALLCFATGFCFPDAYSKNGAKDPFLVRFKLHFKMIGCVVLLLSLVNESYYLVPRGYSGELTQSGRYVRSLDPGVHFVVPFIQHVEPVEQKAGK